MTDAHAHESPDAWWTRLYDDLVAELLLDGADPNDGAAAVRFLIESAGLAPGDRVFDQGCGTGRLARPLLEAGLRVFGVDLMPGYIERARRVCASFGSAAHFDVADIADAVAPSPCRLVVSWWTCLGYAPSDEANGRPMRRAFDSLSPGGFYAVDTMNVAQVLRGFRPVQDDVLRRPDGDYRLRRESRVDLVTGTLHKDWSWTAPDGRVRSSPSAVRLYAPHELIGLLESVGFEAVRAFGDTTGAALTLDSPRCILLARRPS